MLFSILSILLYIASPNHDFHTSWMNMTYNEKGKEFNLAWRTDTEHLEEVLTAFSGNEITLESASIDNHKTLITKYIVANTALNLNGKKQLLEVELIEATFAETIVHFKPITCRRKLKNVGMQSTLLQSLFPNQKNMVQINYKGQMYSMLLGGGKLYEEVTIE